MRDLAAVGLVALVEVGVHDVVVDSGELLPALRRVVLNAQIGHGDRFLPSPHAARRNQHPRLPHAIDPRGRDRAHHPSVVLVAGRAGIRRGWNLFHTLPSPRRIPATLHHPLLRGGNRLAPLLDDDRGTLRG